MTAKTSDETKVLRRHFGKWLKAKRREVGLSQADMAVVLDFRHSTMVSQVETGKSPLPLHDLALWAELLRMPIEALAARRAYYETPESYAALTGIDPRKELGLAPAASTISRGSATKQQPRVPRAAKRRARPIPKTTTAEASWVRDEDA